MDSERLRSPHFQGPGRNPPSWDQVRDASPVTFIRMLSLRHWILPGCGHDTSAARDVGTTFLYRIDPFRLSDAGLYPDASTSLREKLKGNN